MRNLILIVAVAVSLAAPAHAESISHHARSNTSAARAQAEPKPDAQPIIPASVQSDVHSIARALNAANQKSETPTESQREQKNLEAQTRMADWAGRMFFVALAEMLVTLIGVILVAFTLIYTKRASGEAKRAADASEKAVKVTRNIGRAQVRAYLTCEDGTFRAEKDEFSCWPKFKNTGQSPASNIELRASIEIWDEITEWSIEIPNAFRATVPPITSSKTGWVKLSLSRTVDAPEDIFLRESTYYVIDGTLTWTDVFNRKNAIGFTMKRAEGLKISGSGDGRLITGEMHTVNRAP